MRARSSLGLLLTFALLLGGCVGAAVDPASTDATAPRAPLSEPTYALGDFLQQKFPGHDGTPLHVDVQLPEGEGPWPTLIMYSPYSNNLNADDEAYGATAGRFTPPGLTSYYVPRGYAVGIAHVRGSGQSGGCFTMGGPDEAKDGYALVEWIAEQEWSNGKVALMGTSYLGTTPISTATLAPPHLTTIVPVAAVTEWYKYYFENGEPRFFGELPFGVVYTDHPLWMGINFIPKPRNPTALTNAPQNAQCAADIAKNAYQQDDYNAFWMDRNYVKDIQNATAPMLYAHGFLDENTPMSLVPEFFNAYPAEKRMWLQQHGHGVPARFEAYHTYVHRWLDHHMLGLENGALDLAPVIVQDNLGKYHTATEWPEANATTLRFHLGDGALLPEAPAEGAATYRDDPRGAQEPRENGAPAAGSFLQFTSEAFASDVHLSGVPVVHLLATSSARDTQWDVTLYETDGKTLTFVTRGYLDARHRTSLEQGADVTPGEKLTYHFPLHARDHRLAAGNALVLTLASTDKYVVPDAPGATNTIHFGEGASWLEVPVLDLATKTFTDEAPTVT